jgi:3-isopropylmalate dehydrogenase
MPALERRPAIARRSDADDRAIRIPDCPEAPRVRGTIPPGMTAPTNRDESPSIRSSRIRREIAVLPGDGIGKDVTAEAVKVLGAAAERWSLPLELEHLPWSADHFLETGVSHAAGQMERLPRRVRGDLHRRLRRPAHPRHAPRRRHPARHPLQARPLHQPPPDQALRRAALPAQGKTEADVDFVVFRENTEGAYVGVGGNFKKGTPTRSPCRRRSTPARGSSGSAARPSTGRWRTAREVLMADKSNVMRFGHDLWQRCFFEVAADYPQIEASHLYVDASACRWSRLPRVRGHRRQQHVRRHRHRPRRGAAGRPRRRGVGQHPPRRVSMFEPVHGSAPKYAGTGRANPMGAILSLPPDARLPRPRGGRRGDRARRRRGDPRRETTVDLGGTLTREVGDRMARAKSPPPSS